jgi:hypothetical protein
MTSVPSKTSTKQEEMHAQTFWDDAATTYASRGRNKDFFSVPVREVCCTFYVNGA